MRARVEHMTVGAWRAPRGPLATALLADLLISCGSWGFEIALVVTAHSEARALADAVVEEYLSAVATELQTLWRG